MHRRLRFIGLLTLALIAVTVAVSGVFAAQGGVQSGAFHGPGYRGFSAFAINARNPQIVYAGSGRGVFKSSNGGASWQAVNEGLTDRYVFDLAIDQHHPTILYAATNSGVFKTTNAGRGWRATSMPSISTIALALHPRNAKVLYASTDDGVFKSSDAGRSWRAVTSHPGAVRVFALALDPKRPATVYAGAGGGLFKTTDGGSSWRVMNRDGFAPTRHDLAEGYFRALAINPQQPQTLYAGAGYGLFKTTDGAQHWRWVNRGSAHAGPAGSFYDVGSLAIDPHAPETLYAGTSTPGLVKTTTGGRSWRSIDPPGKGDVVALALDPTDPSTIYAGMRDGAHAFKSTDGGRTWSALAIPVP